MSHFGVLSFKGIGHLNPLIALSRGLTARGHRVTVFQRPELEALVRQSRLEFVPIGRSTPLRMPYQTQNQSSMGSGITPLRRKLQRVIADMEESLSEMPKALEYANLDALIIDEIVLSGPTLAQVLHLPYFLVSTSVPHNVGWSVPRCWSGCSLPISLLSRLGSVLLEVSALRVRGPVRWRLDKHRRKAGLGPSRNIQKAYPELAHIAQLPECLDLPGAILPANFYYAGPFVSHQARPSVAFPWRRLDGRLLVYASLGTRRNIRGDLFRVIAEACAGLNLQLVISLGSRKITGMLNDLPGDPLVVANAPQLDLIKRAAVVITHCGANTVLETLLEGKPMVAIPMAFDQPAMAARLHRLKVAEVLSLNRCSAKELRSALAKVLDNSSYSDAALDVRNKIKSVDGVEYAANLIEEALGKYYDSHPIMERRNRPGSQWQITQGNNARMTGK